MTYSQKNFGNYQILNESQAHYHPKLFGHRFLQQSKGQVELIVSFTNFWIFRHILNKAKINT